MLEIYLRSPRCELGEEDDLRRAFSMKPLTRTTQGFDTDDLERIRLDIQMVSRVVATGEEMFYILALYPSFCPASGCNPFIVWYGDIARTILLNI